MKKVNIVFVNSSKSWGGTENWTVKMAVLFQKRGHCVLFIGSSEVILTKAQKAGLSTRKIIMKNDGDIWALYQFYRTFRDLRTNVLITTKWREFLLASLAGKLAGVPVIVMCLGLRVDPKDDLKRRVIFRTVNRVIVNAMPIKQALAAKPWIDGRKIDVIYNGVDLEYFSPDSWNGSLREEIGVGRDTPLIGTIGALTPQKGHRFLIDTIPLIKKEVPQAKFIIVGEGFLRPNIEKQIRESDLQENVVLTGFRTDIPAVLKSIDFLVLSSDNEGMAWVILEAMAMKKAVVATDICGTDEAVIDGKTGLVVDFGDREGLAQAILTLIKNKKLRDDMGEKGWKLARQKFSHENMFLETESLLMRCLSCHGNKGI